MKKYNKAHLGGAGAAAGVLAVWAIEGITGTPVPPGVDVAVATLLAWLLPRFGPQNQE